MKDVGTVVGVVLVLCVLLVFGPMLCVWALNTISEQSGMSWHVPHNFWTYLSVIVLCGAFGRSK